MEATQRGDMKWPWQDKVPPFDGRADDQFGDSWIEIFLAIIAFNLTFLSIITLVYYLGG